MNKEIGQTLKTRALYATAGVLLLVLGMNTAINSYSATSKYREALIARTVAVAEGFTKDINRAVEFGLPLSELTGMGEKLQRRIEQDHDIAYALVMDMDGKILYASDDTAEGAVWEDGATARALGATEPMVQFHSDAEGEYYESVLPLMNLERKQAGVFRIGLKAEAVSRQTRSLLFLSLVVGIVSFIVATAFVYLFMEKGIAGPIRALSQTAARMAGGDLSREIGGVRGHGEITDMGKAINIMSLNLRDMIGRLQQTGASLGEATNAIGIATQKISRDAQVQQGATEQSAMTVEEMTTSIRGVAENAEVMSTSATDASSAVTEMVASIEEVARNAGVLASSAEETAVFIEQMIASIKQVSENTETLSASAEETSASITEMSSSVKEVEKRAVESARLAEHVSSRVSEQGLAAAEEAIRGMDNIKEAVEAGARVVNRLGKRSQEIGQILKVIDEVTDQTGLLALNAAILASQAGEKGKGFAVIAEEIKDLAERTAASTQEIESLISAVRDETAQSVQAMGKGLKAVETGTDLVQVTREVLEQVAESSRQSSDMARAIERTTTEQARGLTQVNEAAVNISHQIEHISRAMQEQRRRSDQIMTATEKMRTITRRVSDATKEQTMGSRQIAQSVESVTAQAGQIARSTFEQHQGAKHISKAVADIQQITQENVDLSVELEIAMQSLRERAVALQEELAKFKL
ncbi:MAG TPA: hypothetical protein DCO77_10550 [Nitrospiraceae bacterium]|nr:hypothetical protein [Nitrospiraceae bacterium]